MNRGKWIVLVVALALMGGGTGVLLRLKGRQELGKPGLKVLALDEEGKLAIDLPKRVRQYSSTNLPPTEAEVTALPADTTIGRRIYTSPGGFQVMLSAVMMGTDRTSIHKPEFCLTSQGWQIYSKESGDIPIGEPQPYSLPIQKYLARVVTQAPDGSISHRSGVYVFWFVAADRLTADHWARVWYLSWDLLRTGVLPRWAYVSCFAVCAPGEEEATFDRLKGFIGAAVPEFQTVTVSAP